MEGLNGGRISICEGFLFSCCVCDASRLCAILRAASCSLGAAWAALEQTTEHLQFRHAFGGPLSHQQVQYTGIHARHVLHLVCMQLCCSMLIYSIPVTACIDQLFALRVSSGGVNEQANMHRR